MALKFPSSEYFAALGAQMAAAQERFSRLGFIDTTFAIGVNGASTARNFILSFEVFELSEAKEVDRIDLASVDFAIAGDASVWREMIENIQRNGEADARHDLNTLAHFGEGLKVTYADPEGHDKLYRFMQSIQEFFDLSGKLEITF
jgi:hypothetical protein